MLYLAAVFAPPVVFAWTRRAWWTGLTILLGPLAVIFTLGIAYIVFVLFGIKFAHEYYKSQQAAAVESAVARAAIAA